MQHTEKILVICTANLPQEEMDHLTRWGAARTENVWVRPYGVLIHERVLLETGLSLKFVTAIRAKAKEHGCDWVMFDRDADGGEGLELFDW